MARPEQREPKSASKGVAASSSSGQMSTERVSRIFDVLELLVGHADGMTLTEISKRLDLPTSSTHNLLQRMVGADLVASTEQLRYSVGSRAVRLGIRIVDGLEVRLVARRYLQELARETGEHIYLAIRLGRRVVYIDRLPGTRSVSVEIQLGQSLFLHATSVGKLFAAHHAPLHRRLLAEPRPKLTNYTHVEPHDLEEELARIRANGFAVSREEAILGVIGLAVPVYDAHGAMVAAIHISTLRAQLTEAREKQLIAAAKATARGIEHELGRVSEPRAGTRSTSRRSGNGSSGD
jgi:DNA-binding IclR family transcriptional regulator